MSINAGPFSLEGKNIIITGASSGIGRKCAITCSQFGANIALVGRDEQRLMDTMDQLNPSNHLMFSQDITRYDEISEIVSKIVDTMGEIEGFIHAAGIVLDKPLHLTRPDDYLKVFGINVFSGFEFARQLAKKGITNPTGASFVFVASVMSVVGVSLKTAYCSSKGAIVSGVRAMALELAKKKIRVNCISPGVIGTEMVDRFNDKAPDNALANILQNQVLGLGTPEDVANCAVYLLSSASSFTTGSNIVVDGGYTIQ